MSWGDFRDSVAQVSENFIPELLRGYDYIWGGADFNLDLKLVVNYIHELNTG
jgi:hypothetical protein